VPSFFTPQLRILNQIAKPEYHAAPEPPICHPIFLADSIPGEPGFTKFVRLVFTHCELAVIREMTGF
jgi:hypothetical protein